MRLEIKDIRAGRKYYVDPAGAVIGSDATSAQIVLSGPKVDGLHARIVFVGGRFAIEDLGSSSGTTLDGELVTRAALRAGSTLTIGASRLEVLRIDEEWGTADCDRTQTRLAGAQPDGAIPAAAPAREDYEPVRAAPPSRARAPSSLRDVVAGFLASTAGAGRRYLVLALRLLFSPRSSLRAGVVEPPLQALGVSELIAWALPPSILVTVAAVLTASPATGLRLSVSTVVGALVIGAIAAMLAGLLGQPLLAALVRLFGGASNARLRSNTLVAHGTVLVIAAVAWPLAWLLAAVPLPALALAPAVVGAGCALLTILVWHAWRPRLGMSVLFEVVLVPAALATGVAALRDPRLTQVTATPSVATRVSSELEQAAATLSEAQARLPQGPAAPEPRAPKARTSIEEYRRRRAAIDRAVRGDASVFTRVEGLAAAYNRLQRDVGRVERQREGKRGRGPSERQIEQQLVARTGAEVDRLYELITAPR